MYLIGLEDKIFYDGQLNKLNMPAQEVNKMFTGTKAYGLTENRDMTAFQLGWDSVVMVEEKAGNLEILSIEHFSGGSFVDITEQFNPSHYHTVVTRAVDFCTFIYLNKGNKHILIHFDSYSDARANKLKEISEEMIGGNVFISLIPEEKKYLEIIAKAGIKNYVMLRSVDNARTYPEGVPECMKAINFNIFGHLEIGLTVYEGNTFLFGDVTNRFRGDGQFPCFRFLGEESAFDAVTNLLNFN